MKEPDPTSIIYRPFGAFRFFLAVLVLVSHSTSLGGLSFLSSLGLGNMAVMTFFVLSGYVIAEAQNTFYKDRLGAFLVNRILRIYPPFYAALAISVLFHALAASQRQLLFFDDVSRYDELFSAENIIGNTLSLILIYGMGSLGLNVDYLFVRYAWAIAVEMQFYVIFTLVTYLVSRLKIRWHLVTAGMLGLFISGMIFGATSYGIGWIPYFILGIAMFRRQTLLACLCILLVNWHAFEYIARNPMANLIAGLAILDVLIAALWGFSLVGVSKFLKRVDSFLGSLSYPLYLNHYVITIMALTFFSDRAPSLTLFFGGVVVAVIFSYLMMLTTEPFTRNLREKIRGYRV